ncbi:TetR/AcrR family transcriptional regulator [candidate division KSB1 bacterium]
MMTSKKNRSSRIRNTLLKESLASFNNSGYTKTSVHLLAERAGIRSVQVRKYFPTKRDIFKALFDEERIKVRNRLDSLFNGVDVTQRSAVSETLKGSYGILQESAILRMIYRFDDFPVWYCIGESGKGSIPDYGETSLLENFLKRCQNSGALRSENVSLIAHTFRSALSMMLHDPGFRQESPETGSLFLDIFVDGLMKSGND